MCDLKHLHSIRQSLIDSLLVQRDQPDGSANLIALISLFLMSRKRTVSYTYSEKAESIVSSTGRGESQKARQISRRPRFLQQFLVPFLFFLMPPNKENHNQSRPHRPNGAERSTVTERREGGPSLPPSLHSHVRSSSTLERRGLVQRTIMTFLSRRLRFRLRAWDLRSLLRRFPLSPLCRLAPVRRPLPLALRFPRRKSFWSFLRSSETPSSIPLRSSWCIEAQVKARKALYRLLFSDPYFFRCHFHVRECAEIAR